MDALKQLWGDMQDAGWGACQQEESETDACLAVLDEFCEEYEVVEPEPDVTELARRVVKAWRGDGNGGLCVALNALAEAVDK